MARARRASTERHRVCKRCHEVTHVEDMGTEFALCCGDCESDEHTEIADDLWDNQITDLVEAGAARPTRSPDSDACSHSPRS